MGEIAGAFGWREAREEAADGGPQRLDGAGRLGPQQGLELGEHLLDRVQVRRVGRQVAQRRASGFDPQSVFLLPYQELNEQNNYAYFLMTKRRQSAAA